MEDALQVRLNAAGYDTDKSRLYLRNYEKYFAPFRGENRSVAILELGVFRGGSPLLWRHYFPGGAVVGLDINPCDVPDPTGRIKVYQGWQEDVELLDRIRNEAAPDGFDIVIDDASHLAAPTSTSFWRLFDHLRPGGVCVIEDWRVGYWDKWADGARFDMPGRMDRIVAKMFKAETRFPSHDYGLVGFVKGLVDELGMDAITHPKRDSMVPHQRADRKATIDALESCQ